MKLSINDVLLADNYLNHNFFNATFLKSIGMIVTFLLLYTIAFCQPDTTVKKVKVIYGVASFYSKHLEGVKTATGEIFHHKDLVAASNNFKLNSWVRITNMRNGKSVVVRINDRMGKAMQALGRVADVTITAATQLGFINRGLARVKVEQVPAGTTR